MVSAVMFLIGIFCLSIGLIQNHFLPEKFLPKLNIFLGAFNISLSLMIMAGGG